MWLITSLALGSSLTGKLHYASCRRCEKPAVITHAFPQVPFHSLQVLLLLATQWPVRAPVKLLGGVLWSPCNLTPIHSLTGPLGQPFASHLGGLQLASQGCTHSHSGTWFLFLALSHYSAAISSCTHSWISHAAFWIWKPETQQNRPTTNKEKV